MATRPPVLIDAIVRALIPPACREHVIGDLWERYRSPWQFLLDAMQTVPFILASRIRRTSKHGLLSVQAVVLLAGLAVGSGGLRRAIVPLAAALVGPDARRAGIRTGTRSHHGGRRSRGC